MSDGRVSTTSPTEPSGQPIEPGSIALLATEDDDHTWELLGDAKDLADRLGKPVIVLTFRSQSQDTNRPITKDARPIQDLIQHGADVVAFVELVQPSPLPLDQPFCASETRLVAVERWYRDVQPRILFIASAGDGRQLAARLAARCEVQLFSPALSARARGDRLEVTALHSDGKRAYQADLSGDQAAILVLNKDVGQPRPADLTRNGLLLHLLVTAEPEAVLEARLIAADPTASDIQHLPRLVAGGQGVGGRDGFEILRTIAGRLQAGVAASRMAVDLGWVERERQVGQSGKTVRPELYIACGISGASHHLEGMSQSRHILAINTDPQAPIFRVAHLGLVADWRETLLNLDSMLEATTKHLASQTDSVVNTR
jgi:electron transfer flavoprotein alpha subunit